MQSETTLVESVIGLALSLTGSAAGVACSAVLLFWSKRKSPEIPKALYYVAAATALMISAACLACAVQIWFW